MQRREAEEYRRERAERQSRKASTREQRGEVSFSRPFPIRLNLSSDFSCIVWKIKSTYVRHLILFRKICKETLEIDKQ